MHCLQEWRRWIRPLVVILYTSILIIALPLIIVDLNAHKSTIHLQAWLISGVFVFLTMPISIWGITQHMVHYTRPELQRCIIRILWMVPIYSINAWFALRFKAATIYLDTLRECYEAYVVYNFMSFLLQFLKSEYPDLEYTIERKTQVAHLFPFCFLPNWPMGRPFILKAKHGVLQYTVVRPISTVIALICELTGKYEEGDFNFKSAWSYLVIVNNISQVWALYCLVMFYRATKEELAPIKPVGKFMCVKAVVFLSFWQAVLIAALVKVGVIKKSNVWGELYDVQDIANGLQDFIITIEMFIAAIAHYFSFSHKPYVDYAAGYTSIYHSFLSMWDMSDVRQDVMEHVRHVGKVVTRPLRGDTGSVSDDQQGPINYEHTPLLNGGGSLSGDESLGVPVTPPPTMTINADEFHRTVISDLDQNGDIPHRSYSDITSLESSTTDTADNFQKKSLTASMNNYAQFSASYSNDGFVDDLQVPGGASPEKTVADVHQATGGDSVEESLSPPRSLIDLGGSREQVGDESVEKQTSSESSPADDRSKPEEQMPTKRQKDCPKC